jgi:four helix bundle protein
MDKAHKKLHVWQEAMELVQIIYELTSQLPSEEKYGLASQMRRAAVSIPSNIAEGAARQGKKDAIQFFVVARGSLSELDTQLELCLKLKFFEELKLLPVYEQVDKVDALLSGLIRYRKTT